MTSVTWSQFDEMQWRVRDMEGRLEALTAQVEASRVPRWRRLFAKRPVVIEGDGFDLEEFSRLRFGTRWEA